MAFNINYKAVTNDKRYPTKATPWRCQMCTKEKEVLLKIKIDYDTLVICKTCLNKMKNAITEKERELKDGD